MEFFKNNILLFLFFINICLAEGDSAITLFPVEGVIDESAPNVLKLNFTESVRKARGGLSLEHVYFNGESIVKENLGIADKNFNIEDRTIIVNLKKPAPATGVLFLSFSSKKGKIIMDSGKLVPDFRIKIKNKSGMLVNLPEDKHRTWLGPDFWANRLQDWQLRYGQIECLQSSAVQPLRTVHIVTREVVKGEKSFHLSMRMGTLEVNNGNGFSGFLIGAGSGKLDYRAAAMVFAGPGQGGGILCVMDMDGNLCFKSNYKEATPGTYPDLKYKVVRSVLQKRNIWEDIQLDLDVVPAKGNTFDLWLSAWDDITGENLGAIVLREQKESDILGSIALVSSPMGEGHGPRFWFSDIRMSGKKIEAHPDHSIGPVIGVLYSIAQNQLKLTAQFVPLGFGDSRSAVLECRVSSDNKSEWKKISEEEIVVPGYSCLFRIPDWDDTKDYDFRIIYKNEGEIYFPYEGKIRRNPKDKDEIALAVFTGMSPMSRQACEGGIWFDSGEKPGVGRWTPECVWVPEKKIVENVKKLGADILFFTGDEIYDNMPTAKEINGRIPELDFLWKWYIWYLTFGDLTRQFPSIVQVDDHDVYHGNLWGMGGIRNNPKTNGDYPFYVDNGGYCFRAEFVNMVQGVACGHNPDPYDTASLLQGITSYYDGKQIFNDGHVIDPDYDVVKETPYYAELLGHGQMEFLKKWAEYRKGEIMKVCISQGPFICAHTTPNGPMGKMDPDLDSGGWPKSERDKVVKILTEANALVIGGDQHLPYFARLGINGYDDGCYQFSVPSVGNYYSRWFYPDTLGIGHKQGQPPYVGGFKDAFGNKFTMYAVANPTLEKKMINGRYGFNNDGFGLVRVKKKEWVFRIECWPWNANPERGDSEQFEGWPIEVHVK